MRLRHQDLQKKIFMRPFWYVLVLVMFGFAPGVTQAQTLTTIGIVLPPGNHMERIDVATIEDAIDFVVIRHGAPGIDNLDFLQIIAASPNLVEKAVLRRGDEVIDLVGSKKLLVMDGREIKYLGPILFTLDELNEAMHGKLGAYQMALERIRQRKKSDAEKKK